MLQLLISVLSLIINITSSSYVIGPNPLNYQNAQAYCESIGGQLASIHSESEYNETKALCQDTNSDCWIGLSDTSAEGVWKWEDGTVTDYGFVNNDNTNPATGISPWAVEQPDDGNLEDCIHLREFWGYLWNDDPCSTKYYPICGCGMYNVIIYFDFPKMIEPYKKKRYWMYGCFFNKIWI